MAACVPPMNFLKVVDANVEVKSYKPKVIQKNSR